MFLTLMVVLPAEKEKNLDNVSKIIEKCFK